MQTLSQYLTKYENTHPEVSGITSALEDIVLASTKIMNLLSKGALNDIYGQAGETNIQGEDQQKLDIIANDILLDIMSSSGNWAGIASEEMEDIFHIPDGSQKGKFLCAFDPLDGSGNIDINMPVGTIFSIMPYDKGQQQPENKDFLRPGKDQTCAGYVLFGASTNMILTVGDGSHSFTFDPESEEFLLTESNITIADSQNYSVNASNYRHWLPPVQQYVDECLAGETGVRKKNYNMRWMGCMVADSHRVLEKGGMFMYPFDSRDPNKPGKLRLLYECNPLSFIIEQAGGRSITNNENTMDVQPTSLHQRVPLMMGHKNEIDYLESLINNSK